MAGEAAVVAGGVAVGATGRVSVVAATGGVASTAFDALAASATGAAAVSELVRDCNKAPSGAGTGTADAVSVDAGAEIGVGGSITGSGAAMEAPPEAADSLTILSLLSGAGCLMSPGTLRAWVCAWASI
ncbi:hypothetical protein [Bradyrhizobium sp. SZCCHNR1098]|uniref:hypothetical protein n=1 Tax=Bradyrhizobium sp. SZCCHNR1098 TaxID=3057370 RepID=UPI002916B84A|nr:hypothetical protein [Bradyrhizobium sp. SZCCHNR1098]